MRWLHALINWINSNNTIVTVLVFAVIAGSLYSIINSLGAGSTDDKHGDGPAHEWFFMTQTGSLAAGSEASAHLEGFEQWEHTPAGLLAYMPARIIACPNPDGTTVLVDVLLYSSTDGHEYDRVSSIFDPLNWHELSEFDASASDPAGALEAAYAAFGESLPECGAGFKYVLPDGPFEYEPEFVADFPRERLKSGVVRAIPPQPSSGDIKY